MKMDKTTMVESINLKLNELREERKLIDKGVSPASGEVLKPQPQNRYRTENNKEQRALKVILALLKGDMDDGTYESFTKMVELRTEKTSRSSWGPGDSLTDILLNNPNMSMNKILDRCTKKGWKIKDGVVTE